MSTVTAEFSYPNDGGLPSEARGRNGWFRPHRVDVGRVNGRVFISVSSRRGFTDAPPIYLNLTRGDAVVLRRALEEAMR